MKPGPRLAIDFGTTRTKIAFYDTDRKQSRLIELGLIQHAIIPSVFYVPKRGSGDILVGDDAMAHIDVDPVGIVREIKRDIDKLGKKYVGPGRLTPTRVELAAEMLRSIRRRCEEGVFHSQKINRCRLTVPVTFTVSQRMKLSEAAELAGFNDILFIDEPTAAAQAWMKHCGERFSDHVVVIDVGGGTTDFSVVEWSNNRFRHNIHVPPEGFSQGGNDIDDQACDVLLDRQSDETQETVRQAKDSFLVKLRSIKEQFARGVKHQRLSSGQTVVEVQPDIFQQAEAEFLDRLIKELKSFLEKCRIAGIDSPVAILVGGASRIAGLKSKVEELCPGKVFTWESADFATVLGAAEIDCVRNDMPHGMPKSSDRGEESQSSPSPPQPVHPTTPQEIGIANSVVNSIGMRLNLIPAGAFMMGSQASEAHRKNDETQHRVTLTNSFYLGTTQVTQGQWKSVMGTTPWKGQVFVREASNDAATYVHWDDAARFCARLSAKEGKTYRLPTEAEWEYACRGGTTTAYSFGDDAAQLSDYGWFDENAYGIGKKYAQAVGLKHSNGFGLHDMHGNVWEWCSDLYGNYPTFSVTDPQGAAEGSRRVIRGGGWGSNAWNCRSAIRGSDTPGTRDSHVGFRVALSSVFERSSAGP